MTDTTRRTFAEEIAVLARGTLNDEATLALAELVDAVAALGKKGGLVLELSVEPTGSAGRTVTIAGSVKVKAPRPDAEVSIRFVGESGSLHVDDPYAKPLPGIPYRDADGTPKVLDDDGTVRRIDESELGSFPSPIDDEEVAP